MILVRLITLFTADVLGFQQFLRGNYRSGLMYALTMGGFFVFPVIDLIDDYYSLPSSIMTIKRKSLSVITLIAWNRFIPNMTIRWFVIYFITGEVKQSKWERTKLVLCIILSMMITGEVTFMQETGKYLSSNGIAISLSLYYTDISTLSFSLNPYAMMVSNMYHIMGILLVLMFNMTIYSYTMNHPIYVTFLLFLDFKHQPSEKWTKENVENACLIFFVNPQFFYLLTKLYAHIIEYE